MKKLIKLIIKLFLAVIVFALLFNILVNYNTIMFSKSKCEVTLSFFETAYKFYEAAENIQDSDALIKFLLSDDAKNAIEETKKAYKDGLLKLDNCNFLSKAIANFKEERPTIKKHFISTIELMEELVMDAKNCDPEDVRGLSLKVGMYSINVESNINSMSTYLSDYFSPEGKFDWYHNWRYLVF